MTWTRAAGALAACIAVAASGTAYGAGRCGDHPWCDTALSPDRRASLLVGALTPDERIALLGSDEFGGAEGAAGGHTGEAFGVPRLDVPPLYLTDGPMGVRQGPATAFPSSMALAATFDRRLAGVHGAAVATEARLRATTSSMRRRSTCCARPCGAGRSRASGRTRT